MRRGAALPAQGFSAVLAAAVVLAALALLVAVL
jgi:hypothetical protein